MWQASAFTVECVMINVSMIEVASKFIQFTLRPISIAVLSLFCIGAIYVVEGRWQHMPYMLLILIFMSSAIFILSKRFAFSVYLTLTIVSLLTSMSVAKYRGQGFDLHVYDILFTGSDVEAIKFLVVTYWKMAVPLMAAMIIGIAGLMMVWRHERPSNHRLGVRVTPLALSAVLIPLAYPVDQSYQRFFYHLIGYNASTFFVSFLDIADSFAEEPIVTRVNAAPEMPQFATAPTCDGFEPKPDIYVVLSESATDFTIYPQVNLQTIPENAFVSEDGAVRRLRVETFGGGTWMSNVALMTGLSTRDFGWRAPYLTAQLEGHINESLATLLNRCGYRSASMTPMKQSFVNEGPFMKSIGFDTVLDYDSIGATAFVHRDDFYYNAADNFIDTHIQSDGRPLFMLIQTMFAHSPFDTQLEPHIQIQEDDFIDNQELNEHIRRVYIAQNDFHAFLERRKELQPDRPFVVLEFGDHQALATRTLADAVFGGNSLADPNSLAYKTQYTLHSHNFELEHKYFKHEQLDIGFLGVSFMQAIGVPLSPMFQDLAGLRDECEGRYSDCQNRQAVDKHLKRRVNSRLLILPGA